MDNTITLDKMREFHVRDIARLTPGTQIIFGHVPTLGDPFLSDYLESVDGSLATVVDVVEASANDLYDWDTQEDWATEKHTVIFYTTEVMLFDKSRHRYASDAGVTSYQGGWFNNTNFTVIVDDLVAAGLTYSLTGSDDYLARLAEFNANVTESDMYDYFA